MGITANATHIPSTATKETLLISSFYMFLKISNSN